MKLKEYISRLTSKVLTPQQRQEFESYLENNDEVAAKLCEYDFPEIIEIVCNNQNMFGRDYAQKYKYVRVLYTKKDLNVNHYINFTFIGNEKKIIPYLSETQLEQLIDVYNEKKAVIEGFKYFGNEKTKVLKSKEDKENNAEIVNKNIYLLKKLLGYSEEQRNALLVAKKEILNAQNFRQKMFYESSISQLEINKDDNEEFLKEIERLRDIVAQLQFDNQILVREKEEAEQRILNLQEIKQELECEKETLAEEREKLLDDKKVLVSNCKEYEAIVKSLNGQIVNALYKPLTDMEKIIFEIEGSRRTTKEIAEWMKEPLKELRENFKCIKLNNENLTELPGNYSIAMDALCKYEEWAGKVPVKYNESKHLCELEATEYVLVRTRGFKYIDNLGSVRINKAEVIPHKEKKKKSSNKDLAFEIKAGGKNEKII